eukprot:199689_1
MSLVHFTLISVAYAIDRTEFSNFRGTERHDSYLSFSSSLSFPLSSKWNRSDIQCTFNNPLINFAFAQDTFYCLTNEIWDLNRNINSSIFAFSAEDGSILWKTEIYKDPTILTSFDGIVYLNGYISVLDDNYGDLYLLNATTGIMTQNVSIKDDCPDNLPNGQYCIQSGIASAGKSNVILAYFTTYDDHKNGTLFSMDENGKTNSAFALNQTTDTAQDPTVCNDEIVITTNLFDTVNAYYLSGISFLNFLWSYTIANQFGTVYDNPALCIPRLDGGFNVLVNSIFEQSVLEAWELLDGKTGKLLKEITWQIASAGIPAINSDKMILVRTSGSRIEAYNISDVNGNWTQLWTGSGTYYDLMIVDEYVFMSNAEQVDVYQINDGKQVFSWTFPIDQGGPFIVSRLSAGVDKNGKPMIIILAMQSFVPTVNSTLFALQ